MDKLDPTPLQVTQPDGRWRYSAMLAGAVLAAYSCYVSIPAVFARLYIPLDGGRWFGGLHNILASGDFAAAGVSPFRTRVLAVIVLAVAAPLLWWKALNADAEGVAIPAGDGVGFERMRILQRWAGLIVQWTWIAAVVGLLAGEFKAVWRSWHANRLDIAERSAESADNLIT